MLLALVLQQSDVQKYGVFAAMVAVAGMIIAAVGGLALLWRGPLGGWEVPEQPKFANRIVVLPSAVFMVAGFLYARPETMWPVLVIGGFLIAVSTITGVAYATKTVNHRRFREVVDGDKKTKKVPVLAVDELTEWAKSAMAAHNLTDQQCFAGTPNEPYEADQVWTRPSRVRVYNRMTILFVITMFCGTGALSWLAYATEVKVTGKAASDVLNPSQIPGKTDDKK